MTSSIRLSLPLALAGLLPGCGASDRTPLPPPMRVTGMVEFVPVEGGCFVFHADDGNDYNLFAEPGVGLGAVLEHGAFLDVELRLRPDLAGFCPGTIAEVLRIVAAALPLASGSDDFLLQSEEGGVTEWRLLRSGDGR